MHQTVLAHVAAPFPQKENLATEALAFILNRSPAARTAVGAELTRLVGAPVVVSNVATQVTVSDESRPDALVYGPEGALVAFIEAKFWAALTVAQPVDYLGRLRSSGGSALLMLAPERRLFTLRAEVLERCRAAGEVVEASGHLALRVTGCTIGFVAWNRLLSSLREAVGDDPAAASDVAQLTGLCARFETADFIPLTRADIDDLDVPRRVLAFANLVNDIVDRAVARQLVSTRGLKATHYLWATGRYAAFERAGFWIGLNHRQWLQHGVSPMWLRFDRDAWGRADVLREVLRPLEAEDPPRAYVSDVGEIRIPLVLPVGVEKDTLVEKVFDQLKDLDARMKAAGLAPLGNTTPQATSADG
jgi:hypothetical protein